MPLQVITSDATTHEIHSPQDFATILNVRYLSHLDTCDPKIHKVIQKKCEKALLKKWITPKQKWLGHYYARALKGEVPLDLTVAWIDDCIGYGVWTNRRIPRKSFVGEYTGEVRKRHFLRRWKNLYCFDYTTGPGRSTSLVIDCKKAGNHTRFINHSFHPNLDLTSVYYEGMMRVILTANQEIPPGAQLCYDYGEDYWEKRGTPFELLNSR